MPGHRLLHLQQYGWRTSFLTLGILFGTIVGLATLILRPVPPRTIISPKRFAEASQPESFPHLGVLIGITAAAGQPIGSLAPYLAGALFDATDSYSIVFL